MRFRKLKKQSKNKITPLNELQSIKYANSIDKIKAFITDIFMIYIPILYLIAYGVLGSKDAFLSSTIAPLIAVILYGLIYSVFLFKSGQTPGKKAYTIRVVDDVSHENISFIRAFFRFTLFLLSAATLLGLLTHYTRKDKKTLHDIIARTIEIEVQK